MGKIQKPTRARGFTYIQAARPDDPVPGDTWYSTSTGRVMVFCEGGWVYPANPDLCLEKNAPRLILEAPEPEPEITTDGGSVTLTLRIKNLDVGVCGETTFTLSVSDSNTDDFDPSTLSQTTVTLKPYQETTVTVTVRDKVGAAYGTRQNTVRVSATAPDHPTAQSNPVTVKLSGNAASG